jgi:methylenetetrahydrofolate reductase (NADPH)
MKPRTLYSSNPFFWRQPKQISISLVRLPYTCTEEIQILVQTHLSRLLEDNRFVVTAEVGPPHGADEQLLIDRVLHVKDYCDALNLTDNVRGIPTMSSMVCSHFVRDCGIEPVMQMSARDRNRILFESELYGAYALGIRNICFMTGDHSLLGSHPEAKMVYDLDSIQALQLASHLMSGKDLAGDTLEGTPHFYLGATFNPYADPLELQSWRVNKKHKAGARFFQTQAIYGVSRFERFMNRLDVDAIKTLAGIIPLKGPRMARFMNRKIPGIKIPETMIQRLVDAGDGLSGKEKRGVVRSEGIRIALETIEKVRAIDGVDGIHIMGVGWEESIPTLVKEAGLYPRPKKGE